MTDVNVRRSGSTPRGRRRRRRAGRADLSTTSTSDDHEVVPSRDFGELAEHGHAATELDPDAEPVLAVENLQDVLPGEVLGPGPPHGRPRPGRRRGLVPGARGRLARPGGRVRLRQVDDRPADHPALQADRRLDDVRGPRPGQALQPADEAAAPRRADDLPGPLHLAEPAPHRRRDRRGAARGAQRRAEEARSCRGCRSCSRSWASTPSTTTATPTSSPAASASASASPGRSRSTPSCWSPTSRSRRSTCRSRRR